MAQDKQLTERIDKFKAGMGKEEVGAISNCQASYPSPSQRQAKRVRRSGERILRLTKEQIQQAKNKDLYMFLYENYGDDYTIEGNSLRMKANHSMSIKRDFTGYYDFGTGDHGDSIQYLIKYYGYTFQEAVNALIAMGTTVKKKLNNLTDQVPLEEPKKEFCLPALFDFPELENKAVTYLVEERCIPLDTVQMLMDEGLLYHAWGFKAVFINYKKDCAEIRETREWVKPQHSLKIKNKDSFWYMGKSGTTVYITESAIDCISLYELRDHEPAIYVSMHGASNQAIIDRIVAAGKYDVILAVDNDKAGQLCRDRNPGLPVLLSEHKDWNEDWIHKTKMSITAKDAEKEEEQKYDK